MSENVPPTEYLCNPSIGMPTVSPCAHRNRTHIDSMQVVGIHDCSLIELDLGEVTFEQSFQLQVRLFPAAHNTIPFTLCS